MKEIEPLDPKKQFERDFKELFDDPIVPVSWDEEKVDRAKKIVLDTRVTTTRFASIPMTCRGRSCPAHARCPLYLENLAPLDEPCPIESKIIAQITMSMMEELEIDPTSTIEVGMVRDLVDQEIQQLRKQNLLSSEDIIQENVVGLDENGEPILKKELHLAVDWEDKIHKRKAALLKQLLATREARVNAGAKILDQASNMANALNEYTKMQHKEQKLITSLGMSGVDSYIEAQEAQKNKSEVEDGDS